MTSRETAAAAPSGAVAADPVAAMRAVKAMNDAKRSAREKKARIAEQFKLRIAAVTGARDTYGRVQRMAELTAADGAKLAAELSRDEGINDGLIRRLSDAVAVRGLMLMLLLETPRCH
jgi:hypothetical protein